MEIVTVSGPPPDDTNSPEYLAWHEREFVMRGNLVLNQSSQIDAMAAHVRSLEKRVADIVMAARGLVKPPEPLELVEDKSQAKLPEDPQFPDEDPPQDDEPDAP